MGLRENIRQEPVSRLALREPATAAPETSLREAIQLMRSKQLGCVIVIDNQRKPLGIFTERMLTRLLARNAAILTETLNEHMSEFWPSVRLTDSIEQVLDAMLEKDMRFLAVIDEEGCLAGLAGQKGLMEYVAEHFPGQVMVQRIGGAPYTQNREGA